MPTSQELIQQFKDNYGLTLDFMEVFGRRQRINKMASQFLGTRERKVNATKNYMGTLSTLLDNYLANAVRPTTKYNNMRQPYKLDERDVVGFVKDYEKIIQTMYEEVRTNKTPRLSYMGAFEKTFKMAKAQMAAYAGKTVTEAWAADMANGKLDIGEMRDAFKKEDMPLQNKFLMYNAMKDLIEKRSIGWYFNPLNWRDWHHQRNFMKELSAEVEPVINSIPEDTGTDFEPHFELDEDEEVREGPMTEYEKREMYRDVMFNHRSSMISDGYELRFDGCVDRLNEATNDDLYYEHRQFMNDHAGHLTSDKELDQKWALHLEELENKKNEPTAKSEFINESKPPVKDMEKGALS